MKLKDIVYAAMAKDFSTANNIFGSELVSRIETMLEERKMANFWCGMKMGRSREKNHIKMMKDMENGFIGLIMGDLKKKKNIQMVFRRMVSTMIILTIREN